MCEQKFIHSMMIHTCTYTYGNIMGLTQPACLVYSPPYTLVELEISEGIEMYSIGTKYIGTFLPHATVLPEGNIARSTACRQQELVITRDPVGTLLVGEMSPRVTAEDLANCHVVDTSTHQITGQRITLHAHTVWRNITFVNIVASYHDDHRMRQVMPTSTEHGVTTHG